MSASHFVGQASRTQMKTHGHLNRGYCCCHPPAWGLKKGLRRGRRRLSKALIEEALQATE